MTKIEAFCSRFVTAAFHRPVTDEQRRVFITAQLKKPEIKTATEPGKAKTQ